MGDFKINEKTVFTQSGSDEPAMGSTVTGIPAAGVTGVLPVAVTGGSGLTALGTVTAGNISHADIVYPAGHIIQINTSTNHATDLTRTGDKSDWASTGITCVLANDLKSSSKLFATFSTIYSEDDGGHWSTPTAFTFYQDSTNRADNTTTGLSSAAFSGGSSYGKYMCEQVTGFVLFTPTGSGATQRTVELYWKSISNTASYTVKLNGTRYSSTDPSGGTTIVLMEVAG